MIQKKEQRDQKNGNMDLNSRKCDCGVGMREKKVSLQSYGMGFGFRYSILPSPLFPATNEANTFPYDNMEKRQDRRMYYLMTSCLCIS